MWDAVLIVSAIALAVSFIGILVEFAKEMGA